MRHSISMGLLFSLFCFCLAQGQPLDDSFLTGVETETVEIGGTLLQSPLRYRENVQTSASFCVPVSRVKPLLPSEDLELSLVRPDTTVLVMAASEFRKIDGMKPYNQFGIFIPVTYKGVQGFFAVYLPASSEESVKIGAEGCGFPKSIAQVHFEETQTHRHCHVEADGKRVLTFTVKKIPTKLAPLETYCYSAKSGKIFSYRIQSRGYWEISDDPQGASFRFGEHAFGQSLEAWQIEGTPISLFYSPRLQSLLYKPVEQGTIKK